MIPVCVLAARHGDIVARLHVQRAAGFDAQRHIALDHEFRQIAVFVPIGGDVGSVRIHELFHFCNVGIAVISHQIINFNDVDVIGKSAYRARRVQRDIVAEDVRRPLRLHAAAAVRVHQLVADGVKHHFFRPLIGGLLRLVLQLLIVVVRRKIGLCAGIILVLVCVGAFQIFRRRFVVLISEIILMAVGGELRRFLRVGQSRVVARASEIIVIVLRGKGGIGGGLLCGVFRLPICLCFLVGAYRTVFVEFRFVGARDTRRIIVAVLFEVADIRSLIAVFALDEPCVDPAMDHFVHAVRGAGFVVARQPVDESAACDGQLHVPFAGLDFAHAHIAADCRLGQIDVALCAGVDLRAVAVRGIDEIRTGDLDGLPRRANAAALAGQIDTPTYYGSAVALLGDIPVRGQGHVAQLGALEFAVAVLALQRDDFHVPRQGQVLEHAAHGGDVDISRAGGNGAELNLVIHRSDIALGVFCSRADGSDMDILDIVFRLQSHDLALQERVVKLGDLARSGADVQLGLIMGVRHIARQVDAAARVVGALDVDTAFFRANKADGDAFGSVYGVIVSLEGFRAFIPTGIVVPEPAKESRIFLPSLLIKYFAL